MNYYFVIDTRNQSVLFVDVSKFFARYALFIRRFFSKKKFKKDFKLISFDYKELFEIFSENEKNNPCFLNYEQYTKLKEYEK